MTSEAPTWRMSTVGAIADVIGGGTPKTSVPAYWGDDVGWLTPRDLRDYGARYISRGERSLTAQGLGESAARLLPKGTLLVSSRAPIGYVAIAGTELATNQGFRSLVLKPSHLPEFYYYVMKTKKHEMEAVAGGSTFKEISGRVMQTIPVPVPPFSEQCAIAEVLGALDDRIEWCRSTTVLVEKTLLATVRQARTSERMPVSALGRFVNGGAYTKDADGTGRLIIRIAELNGGIGPSSKFGDLNAPPERTAYPGDLLFSWSGTLDVFRWTQDEAVVNQHIFKVIPADELDNWLVYAKLRDAMPEFQRIAADRATTMGHIKRTHLDEVMVQASDLGAEGPAVELCRGLWKRHLSLHREASSLERLRDLLLPELLSGRLRIDNPERLLEDVA